MFSRGNLLGRLLQKPCPLAQNFYPHSYLAKHRPRYPTCDLVNSHARAQRGHCTERKAAAAYSKRSGTGIWTVAIAAGITIGGASLVSVYATSPERERIDDTAPSTFDVTDLSHSYLIMSPNTPPGRPGTLTADEERKLRELWAITLKVFGVDTTTTEEANGVEPVVATPVTETPVIDPKKDKKKSRLNVFKRHKGEKGADTDSPSASSATTPSDISRLSISADDDKFGQTAEFKAAIANTPPEELRRAFWSMVKHDHPDALLLRFLRARKWDVEKALVMMISTMHWRSDEMHVDDDIVKNGELGATTHTKDSDAKAKKNADDFLTQLRMGKSYLHGLDIDGRPMCFVRARLHKAGEQTEQSLERFTVYTIETARMLLRPPIDTATIVFDMTDFSLANMDYTPVKFMIKCFEANYPESLGTVLVYKAPWLFNAIWSIIRGWLDPVVASKVHFAKNVDELAHYVPKSQIPAELGGGEQWSYSFPEPVPGENDRMDDVEGRERLEGERRGLVERFEAEVLDWAHHAEGRSEDARRQERDQVAELLRVNYWKLDPYVRARTLYDRLGVLQEGGKLEFYAAGGKKEGVVSGKTVETSADDLD